MLVVGLLADALQALGVEGDVRDGPLVWISQRLLVRCQHVIAVLLFYPAANAKAWMQFPLGQAALLALAAQNLPCQMLLAAESGHLNFDQKTEVIEICSQEHKAGHYCSQTVQEVWRNSKKKVPVLQTVLQKFYMRNIAAWRHRCTPALTL